MEIKAQITDIYDHSTKLIQLHTKSAKLEIYERVTSLIATGISSGFIVLFGLFCFLFLNFGFAYYLSSVFESRTIGFFLVGGFYFVVLGIYLLLKNKVAKNKVKNTILLKVSKDMDDFDQLLVQQEVIHANIKTSTTELKTSFDALKSNFVAEDKGEETVGPKIPRVAITSIASFLIKNVLLKRAGFVVKNGVPLLANALITSKLFNEKKTTSLIENVKLKISKFFN
jgi:hypothetical protein